MFTGIIEEIGEVAAIDDTKAFRTIRIRGNRVFDDLKIGSSIAVNGVCLTVRAILEDNFTAEMSRETLERTSLGILNPGSIVNLERPMRADAVPRTERHALVDRRDARRAPRGLRRHAQARHRDVRAFVLGPAHRGILDGHLPDVAC